MYKQYKYFYYYNIKINICMKINLLIYIIDCLDILLLFI
jgi:hypothetical protein